MAKLVLIKKIQLGLSLRMAVSVALVLMFTISAYNNHTYLTQVS